MSRFIEKKFIYILLQSNLAYKLACFIIYRLIGLHEYMTHHGKKNAEKLAVIIKWIEFNAVFTANREFIIRNVSGLESAYKLLIFIYNT